MGGCVGSRFEKRKSTSTDLNTVGIQFVGGEGSNNDFCPQDAISLFYGESQEVDEWLEVGPLTMDHQGEGERIALEAWNALVQQGNYLDNNYSYLKHNFGGSDSFVLVGGKYLAKDAIAQIEEVKAFLKEKNPQIEFPEEEGGGEGGMEKQGLYAQDSAAYDGFANLPALLLRCCTAQPYFGDLVKSALIHYEFNFKGKKINDVPMPKNSLADLAKNPLNARETTPGQWAGIAALVAAALEKAKVIEADVWFSGYLGAQDVEALQNMVEGDNILFPGWMAGWKSEAEALTHLPYLKNSTVDNTCDKVIIKTNTKCASAVVCHLFVQRFNGKLKSFVQGKFSKIWTLTVEDDSWEYSTLADWQMMQAPE